MEQNQIKQEIFDIVREYVEIPDDFDTSLNLKMAAGLNSFALMSLAATIEEHFDVTIPSDVLKSIKNMDDIIKFIVENKK